MSVSWEMIHVMSNMPTVSTLMEVSLVSVILATLEMVIPVVCSQ